MTGTDHQAAATPAPEHDSTGSPDGRTCSGPADAATPGQAALKLEFENWLGSTGYDEDGMFDADEMEFAFEAGAEAGRDLAAREPHAADGQVCEWCTHPKLKHEVGHGRCFDRHDDATACKCTSFAPARALPEPQPAPGPAKPDLGTAWRLLNETRAELATLRALHAVTAGFATEWAGLFTTLPDDYGCEMTCAEANAAADLYRALCDDDTAQAIITAHAEHDDDEERASHVEGK